MGSVERVAVEVAYATPARQVVLKLVVEPGTTLEQAIRLSGILGQFPEIDLTQNKVGIFGRLGKLTDILQAGDRVEIYRPLIADPKEVRKRRAARGKAMKKGAGGE
jgi:putative ubiquitin-RnfH superfamily antitoxin RatB of RatAB toxin-antitoxin module